MAVIETLHAGVPVVCSSVESNQEILRAVGLDFNLNDDIAEYEERLREILTNFFRNDAVNDFRINDLDKFYDWGKYLKGCLEVYSGE